MDAVVGFGALNVPTPLLRALEDCGFEHCTPIQAQSLPWTLRGADCIGKAQTGTGKTAAFLLTIMADLLRNPPQRERYRGEPRALVLAPTRELVQQILADARDLGRHTRLSSHMLIGGADYQQQFRQFDSEATDILIATPGRLMDFVDQSQVHLDRVEMLVIDEADRMLDMGFIPQVRAIVRQVPKREYRQTMLFSATIDFRMASLARNWTLNPIRVEIEPDKIAAEGIDQRVYMVSRKDKMRLLLNILRSPEVDSAIVFANTREMTRRVHRHLRDCKMAVGMLSGAIEQIRRERALESFRSGVYQVMVATDVAGRGLHIEGVSHVINYDLPDNPEDYVHRIGRTGRAGKIGTSISFASEDDAFVLPAIEGLLGNKLSCEQPPESLLK